MSWETVLAVALLDGVTRNSLGLSRDAMFRGYIAWSVVAGEGLLTCRFSG